jgi:hypothetical protein
MKLKFVQNIVIQVKTRQIFFSERKMQSFQKTNFKCKKQIFSIQFRSEKQDLKKVLPQNTKKS